MERISPPEPGFYEDVPFKVYQSWDAINASFLKDVDETPATAQYNKLHPDGDEEEKKYFRIGRAMHTLITHPQNFDKEYGTKPLTYVNEKGEEKKWNGNANVCKAQLQIWLSEGITILSQSEKDVASGMAASIKAHPLAKKILDGGMYEVSLVWVDEKTGLICKARLDVFKGGVTGDWKSTGKPINGSSIMKTAANLKYYLQSHHYEQGVVATGLSKTSEFGFFFVKNSPPYLVDFYQPDITFLTAGEIEWKRLMHTTAECVKQDKWPGLYDPDDERTWIKDLMAAPWLGAELGV